MPYTDMPWVKNGLLMTETEREIEVGTPAWFRWLQTATRFCYTSSHAAYRLTARKEKRGHSYYWYGYARIASKLHNIYLGKSERLTAAHLDQACAQLARKGRDSPTP